MQSIYSVERLAYGTPEGRRLQEGLTFTLRHGQMLLITGSNGCGKSTLLKTLLGRFPVEEGCVRCGVPSHRIEYIPQLENTEVHFPLTLRDVLAVSQGRKIAWEDVASLGLLREDQLDGLWNTASGGERKRTLLARALLRKPWLLVFDEPMNHLDAGSRRAMIRVMADFLRGADCDRRGIVMVCHQGLHDDERELFDVLHVNLDERTSWEVA